MQLVPVRSQQEIEQSLLAMRIAWQLDELAQLQTTLAPLEAAFAAFEQRVAKQSASVTAERNRLKARCTELESFTARIHARLTADPDGVLDSVFTPAEVRRIGELFGVDIPDDWFGVSGASAQEGRWEWADPHAAHEPESASILESQQEELRRIYRELARVYHPDLARDQRDYGFRQEMMHRINDAWHARDLAALRAIRRDTGAGTAAGFALVWHRQELVRLQAACAQVRERIAALRRSRTRALWHDPALAQASIARHVKALNTEITELQARELQAEAEFRSALQWYASARAR